MEQWQMWSLRRTENPRELDRNQPAPHMVMIVQLVRTPDCGSGGHGFEARSSPKDYGSVGERSKPPLC